MNEECLSITVKSRHSGQYYMYILTLIKKSNQKIGRLSPLVKEVEECGQLYKNLVEAKIQVRGALHAGLDLWHTHLPLQFGVRKDSCLGSWLLP